MRANSSCFFLVQGFFRPLDERHHVTHAQDPAHDPVGVEGLKAVRFFARANELDRLAGDMADGERRAATGVTIHPGEHRPRQR